MNLFIQDPTNPESLSLQEALLEACNSATSGGGAFAFVSLGGVKLYLEDETFRHFIKTGDFHLVVGIDQITDGKTLLKLSELESELSKLKISAFLNETNGSLFHPKFCWFKKGSKGKLIVGSGNLTTRGLRKNWEAFSIIDLNETELVEIESLWASWLNQHDARLKSVTNEAVIEKANSNVFQPKRVIKSPSISPVVVTTTLESPEDSSPWIFDDTNQVLIYEIPGAGTRWKQANFQENIFYNFFNADKKDPNRRILLRNISANGDLGEIENRPYVSVKSKNHRIELAAAAGLEYPSDAAPIGIFIKVSTRMFLYTIVMPNTANFNELADLLNQKWAGSSRLMRNIILPVQQTKQLFPNLPPWKVHLGATND